MPNRMRPLLFIFILLLISCSPRSGRFPVFDDDVYGRISAGMPKKDSLVVKKLSNGDTASMGRYAVTKEGSLSDLKTGYWKKYGDNGKLNEEGEYRMGSMVDCCVAGQCMTYYHYKIGDWKYYDSEGRLLYQVNYKPEKLHVDTRCEGGDYVIYGLIKNPLYLREVHNLTADSINALEEVVIEDEYGGITILKPMNGKLIIDFKINKEKLGITK